MRGLRKLLALPQPARDLGAEILDRAAGYEARRAAAIAPIDQADKLRRIREFCALQAECAAKAQRYEASGTVELAGRFRRASLVAMNAVLLMQAALMAEREPRT